MQQRGDDGRMALDQARIVAQAPARLQTIAEEQQKLRLALRVIEHMGLAKTHADDARVRSQAARALAADQAGADVADAGEGQGLPFAIVLGDGRSAATAAVHRLMHARNTLVAASNGASPKASAPARAACWALVAVADAVEHQHTAA